MAKELPIGAYDTLITEDLAQLIAGLPGDLVLKEALEVDESSEVLARHLYFIIRRALSTIREEGDSPTARINLSNQIVQAVNELVGQASDRSEIIYQDGDHQILTGVRGIQSGSSRNLYSFEQPEVRLSQSALLVNGRNQPSIGNEIRKELTSADDVSFIVSFLKNSGVNLVEAGLRNVIARGGRVRVLTTTYTGATERSAVDRLCRLGAEVRISYDTTRTRLHAKSWIFKRNSGLSTGYVGSSNLSAPAMQDGVEWNLRISAHEQPHLIRALETTFDDAWNDNEFVQYDPDRDGDVLATSLKAAKAWGSSDNSSGVSISFAGLDLEPRPFQQEVLDQLQAEREVHGRNRNLVVMATGTGKTVVAALDFRRLFDAGKVKSLLFVAHRKEILDQSRNVFRTALKQGTFGEMLVDGERPKNWQFVFASVQSLAQINLAELGRDRFDMVIVDEFHHAAADTYVRLLDFFDPKYLVGLTATPERTDGLPVTNWFDGVYAAELRLWEAIDRQVLCPFQYFGIYDNVDLEKTVSWSMGKYSSTDLSNVYTGNDARAALVLAELQRHVSSIDDVKAIGFCVSVDHAKYMTEVFNRAGVPSECVVGETDSDAREKALLNLRSGATKVIFARDIFNEGVDVPDVNTLLMLRPTESATIFLQQLGRGLRRTPNKNCLTVLDFVGNQNKSFRFDQKYGRLLGLGKKRLADSIEDGFPPLPTGCLFELDEVAAKVVLSNLKQSLGFTTKQFRESITTLGDISLAQYVIETGTDLEDLYRGQKSFTTLKNLVIEPDYSVSDVESAVGRALKRSLHIDDLGRIQAFKSILRKEAVDPRYMEMFKAVYFGPTTSDDDFSRQLKEIQETQLEEELQELLEILSGRISHVTIGDQRDSVLQVHGTYSRAEIGAGFGLEQLSTSREGVFFDRDRGIDFAFVTLHKTEKHFSPTTMYADAAIDEWVFQWESQSLTSEESKVGARYINQPIAGTSFHLFVREHKNDPETGVTMPYKYFGPANYLSHQGSKPMRIRWKLEYPLPAELLVPARVLSA